MLKRTFDLLISSILIVVLSPVILIVFFMVRWKLGRPAFFTQVRPGLHGKLFTLYKFRTMTDQRDDNGELLPDEIRLTGFGSLLRKLSLDELPQLFNVVLGDMSLVGPRPLLVEYLTRYNDEQRRRHNVRPGITGLAQVKGRNLISWEEKFAYDVWYVDHQSFWLDLTILMLTVKKVIRPEGINQEGYATVSEFLGNENHNLSS